PCNQKAKATTLARWTSHRRDGPHSLWSLSLIVVRRFLTSSPPRSALSPTYCLTALRRGNRKNSLLLVGVLQVWRTGASALRMPRTCPRGRLPPCSHGANPPACQNKACPPRSPKQGLRPPLAGFCKDSYLASAITCNCIRLRLCSFSRYSRPFLTLT